MSEFIPFLSWFQLDNFIFIFLLIQFLEKIVFEYEIKGFQTQFYPKNDASYEVSINLKIEEPIRESGIGERNHIVRVVHFEPGLSEL